MASSSTIINHNSPHHNQPTGSKSISTHRKSKSKSNPSEIKIKINPPEIKIKIKPTGNQNQPTNLLRRRPMVSTKILETSHGFHRPATGAPPIPLANTVEISNPRANNDELARLLQLRPTLKLQTDKDMY